MPCKQSTPRMYFTCCHTALFTQRKEVQIRIIVLCVKNKKYSAVWQIWFINGGSIYTNTYSFSATEGRTTKFGMPKRSEEEAIGELAAWNAEVPNVMNYGVIVYDQTNQCIRITISL